MNVPLCPRCNVRADEMTIEPRWVTVYGGHYTGNPLPVTVRDGPDRVTVGHKSGCGLAWVFHVEPDVVPTAVPGSATAIEELVRYER